MIRHSAALAERSCASFPSSSAYDAVKHWLSELIKTIAIELGQYGITASAVASSEIATPMTGQKYQDPHTPIGLGCHSGGPGTRKKSPW